VMGSSRGFNSCDEAQLQRWTGNDLVSACSARLVFGRSRLGRSLDLTPFFPLERACTGEHKGIRCRLWCQGPIMCALMGCRLLVRLRSGVTVLALVFSFALQASVCNLVAVLLTSGLPKSSRYHRLSYLGGLFT